MNPVSDLAVNIGVISSKLEALICSLGDRIDKNTRGIMITHKDLAPLYTMHLQLQLLLDKHIPHIEQTTNALVVSDAFTKGRLDQLLKLINRCNCDYVAHGRNDAVDEICYQMKSLGYVQT